MGDPDNTTPTAGPVAAPAAGTAQPVARRSPVHGRHVALGAKLADFGGWQMPIEYPGGGVLKEHAAVREAVGLFDVSHLGKAVVRGPGAAAFIDATLTNDLGRITAGQAQYTLCCDDATGGVVDDLIACLRSDDEVFLVPNAANAAEVIGRLTVAAPGGIEVRDEHEALGVLAVQGPRCDEVLEAVGLPAGHAYMSFTTARWERRPVIVCRTGYTGERGYELLPRWEDTADLWDALLAAGGAYGIRPCGLGARDTLRLEMGYPLHGQDLTMEITPVQARTGWAVGWRKPAFWGRAALLAQRQAGAARTLRGLLCLDRAIPRAQMPVMSRDGTPVGEVTSGSFSPSLRQGIALALLERTVADDAEVTIDVRGRACRARVVSPPFVPSHTA
jgi:aminomethyltransferase